MTVHEAGIVDTIIITALKLYDPPDLPDTILIIKRSQPTPLWRDTQLRRAETAHLS